MKWLSENKKLIVQCPQIFKNINYNQMILKELHQDIIS